MTPHATGPVDTNAQPYASSPQKRILLIGWIEFALGEWKEIESNYRVQIFSTGDRNRFLDCCRTGAFDGVVAIARSNQSQHLTGKYDRELIDALPKSVGYICNIGSGVDSIDLDYCASKKILVSNTPSVGRDAVADCTIFLMLGCLRRATASLSRVRSGRWQEDVPIGFSPQGMTIGLLGMGAIATAVAERAMAFGMNVQYYSRRPKTIKLGGKLAQPVSLETVLRTSDIISVHLPLSESTNRILSVEQFSIMKKPTIILNTARGGHVDHNALREALDNGTVWAAGLDVFEREPEVPEWMAADERVFLTPHVATRTRETRGEMEKLCMANVRSVMDGKTLITPV